MWVDSEWHSGNDMIKEPFDKFAWWNVGFGILVAAQLVALSFQMNQMNRFWLRGWSGWEWGGRRCCLNRLVRLGRASDGDVNGD